VEKLPQLWSFLYSKSDRPSRDSLVGKLKRAAEKLNTRKLNAEIERLAPDVIPLARDFGRPSCCPANAPRENKAEKTQNACHLWVQVTDFDVHALWVHPHVDRYCGSEACRVPPRRPWRAARENFRTGPVMPQFSAPRARRVRAGVCLTPDISRC
jgi:processive 1,2-diacylglycerol beta-glucosyltransferase